MDESKIAASFYWLGWSIVAICAGFQFGALIGIMVAGSAIGAFPIVGG